MVEKKAQFYVGITAVIGICIIVLGTIWGKELRFAQDSTTLRIRFENVGGLSKGDPVMWSGINSGDVVEVKIDPSGQPGAIVFVRLKISDPTIYTDYSIRIEDFGLMGDKMVTIYKGISGQPINLAEILAGKQPQGIQVLTQKTSVILDQINTFLTHLNSSVNLGELNQSMKESIDQMRSAAVDLRELVAENKPAIERAVRNFEASSQKINEIISENDETITHIVNSADSLITGFNAAIAHWDSSIVFLDTLRVYVENNDGTMRKLFTSDSLYNELRAVGYSLDSLLTQARDGKLHLNLDWW